MFFFYAVRSRFAIGATCVWNRLQEKEWQEELVNSVEYKLINITNDDEGWRVWRSVLGIRAGCWALFSSCVKDGEWVGGRVEEW